MKRLQARWVLGAATAAVVTCGSLALAALGAGCAEAGDGLGGSGAGTFSTASSTSTSTSASGSTAASTSTSTSAASGSSGAAPDAKVVVNEIDAKGGNWVELANPGTTSVDIGGYGLCDDVDPTMGHACDMTTIVTFPAGTTLPPGGFLLVVGNEAADAGVGPHVSCLADGGPTTCFYASWKISASNGEMVHLLDSSLAVVDEELYPANAVSSGETWGRLPDGTGAFAANRPTPGAANEGP